MAKAKTKMVILEGQTEMTNPELVSYMIRFANSSVFALTQKPRVQVAQAAKTKKT